MAATGLVVTPEVDTTKAKDGLEDLLTSTGKGLDSVVGAGGAVERQLDEVGDAARQAAADIKKINLRDALQAGVDKIGDFKDTIGLVGKDLLGLKDTTLQMVTTTGDLAEKGASIGAAFGPWGAIIGGAVGAMTGFVTAMFAAEAAEQKLTEATRKEAEERDRIRKEELRKFKADIDAKALMIRLDVEATAEEFIDFGKVVDETLNPSSLPTTQAALKARATDLKAVLDIAKAGSEVTLNNIRRLENEVNTLRQGDKSEETLKKIDEVNAAITEQKAIFAATVKSATPQLAEYTAVQNALGTAVTTTTGAFKSQNDALIKLQETTQRDAADSYNKYVNDQAQKRRDWEQAQLDATRNFLNARLKEEDEDRIKRNKEDEAWAKHRIEKQLEIIRKQREVGEQVKAQAIEIGAAVASSIGGQAVEGINAFYDAWANGEKRSEEDRKRARADFARAIGSQLMTDGIGHMVMGGVKALVPLTRKVGLAELAGGAAEFAIGVGMGGVGAIAQRRLGGTESTTPERGDAASLGGNSGTQVNTPIVINMNSAVPATERDAQTVAGVLGGLMDRRRHS
jgi:hypothetical protein